MEKDFLIKLTNNLYRLTLLFPKKEPLRYKMRELADDILVNLTEEKLEILNNFFEVAKSQNWVSPSNILEIQKEYDSLKGELEQSLDVRPRGVGRTGEIIPGRQQKILEILKEKGRAQVWEIQKIFPEVTKRTLRRDFESLLNQDLIERIGERNETYYTPARQSRVRGGEEDLSSST
jgi:predicted HTH transcriptional regulator